MDLSTLTLMSAKNTQKVSVLNYFPGLICFIVAADCISCTSLAFLLLCHIWLSGCCLCPAVCTNTRRRITLIQALLSFCVKSVQICRDGNVPLMIVQDTLKIMGLIKKQCLVKGSSTELLFSVACEACVEPCVPQGSVLSYLTKQILIRTSYLGLTASPHPMGRSPL